MTTTMTDNPTQSNLDFETLNPLLAGQGSAIDITPDTSLFRKMGQVGYQIEEAIAELVDNSVDACADFKTLDPEKIGNIIVNMMGLSNNGAQAIEIFDDGIGMTEQQAREAVILAKSNKTDTHIGKFGMGMKTSCTFLGGRFVLETTTIDDDAATIVVYDEEEFTRNRKWELKSYRMPKTFPHGTRIRIERLRVNLKGHGQGARKGNTPIDRVMKLLARQHRIALQAGSVYVTVNKEPLQASHPIWNPQWLPVLTKFDFPINGKRVHGVAGIANTLYGKGMEYGFDIIRHGRIVKEYEKIGFKPHPMKNNIYGTINLDDFDVTNNKMDFIRDTPDWDEMEDAVSKAVDPIITAIGAWFDPKGGPSTQKDTQSQFVLIRKGVLDANGSPVLEKDGSVKEDIHWELPGHELVWDMDVDKDGKPEKVNFRWVPVLVDDHTDASTEEPEEEPDAPTHSGPVDPIENDTVTEEGQDGDSVETDDSDTNQKEPSVYQSKQPSGPSMYPSRGIFGDHLVTREPHLPGAGAAGNGRNPFPASTSLPMEATAVTEFEGSVGDTKYRHRVSYDGSEGRHQTNSRVADGVLEVITNMDHWSLPSSEAARTYSFTRNIAEAIAEDMMAQSLLPCDQLVQMIGTLMTDLSVR